MKPTPLLPSDYVFTGGLETSFLYIGTAVIYAGWSVHAPALMITKDGVTRLYIGREGIVRAKDDWLTMEPATLDRAYEEYKQRWRAVEPELYGYISSDHFDWRAVWNRIEELNKEFWKESYKIEVTDSFAEEFQEELGRSLDEARLDRTSLHELITPAEPTMTQQAEVDLHRVANHALDIGDYVRTYWYRNGTWIGGHRLQEKEARELLENLKPEVNDWVQRQALHDLSDQVMNERARNLFHLMRTLTLWREERKAYTRQVNCCLQRVVDHASREFGVDPSVVVWSWPDEIDVAVSKPELFVDRARASLLMADGQNGRRLVLAGAEALRLMTPFYETQTRREFQGVVASRGKATGKVRVVVQQKDFGHFTEGEVLVTTMTRPEFVPLMQRAAAIVTDEGGLTSHAAIVSRELQKPCIVGTKNATHVLKDGDMVEVDADRGIVRLLK